MKPKYPRQPNNDVMTVFNMLTPKPKPLLYKPRTLVRHGTLTFFSSNTMSKKPRYFFLFTDCLLITKKKSNNRFRLRIFIHLRSNVKLQEKDGSLEFRLLVPVLSGRGHAKRPAWRPIIMFARDQTHKRGWVRDLKHCLWNGSGRIGPDPSGVVPYTGPQLSREEYDRQLRRQRAREEEEERAERNEAPIPYGAGSDGEGDDGLLFEAPSSPREAEALSRDAGKDSGAGPGAPDPFLGNLLDFSFVPDDSGAAGGSAPPPAGVDIAPHLQTEQSFAAFDQLMGVRGGDVQPLSALDSGGGGPDASAFGQEFGQEPFMAGGAGGVDPLAGFFTDAMSMGVDGGLDNAQLAGGATLGSAALGVAGSLADLNSQPFPGGDFPPSSSGGGGDGSFSGFGGGGADGPFGGVGDGVVGGAPVPASGLSDDDVTRQLLDASRALEALLARPAPRADPQAPPSFDGLSSALLDSTKGISAAAAQLLHAAAEAQSERERTGFGVDETTGKTRYRMDPEWSDGLRSAATSLVAMIRHLVETAEKVRIGEAGEERLIAASREVNAATARLVSANKVKGRRDDARLDDAARRINGACKKLVEGVEGMAAQRDAEKARQGFAKKEERYNLTSEQVAEIEAQSRIIKLEKEAEMARKELESLRKQKYGN